MSEQDEVENTSLDTLEGGIEDSTSPPPLEEEVPTKTLLEERREKMKKSRWNVLMYLGLATILFSFSLFPMTTEMEVGYAKDYETGYIFGLPITGPDYTDIPVEIIIEVKNVPIGTSKIEVFIIKADYCTKTINGALTDFHDEDGNSLAQLQIATRNQPTHQRQLQTIEDIAPGETYTLDFNVDAGSYCMQIITDTGTGSGLEVKLNVTYKMYPFQIAGGAAALFCLLLSAFAFIGAHKHGKEVREAMNPNKRESIESQVLLQTSADRISAGPRSGPASGPSSPPVGPSAPSAGPSASPAGPTSGPTSGPSSPPAGPSASPVADSLTGPPSGPPSGPPLEEITVEAEPLQSPEPISEPSPEPSPEPIVELAPVAEAITTPVVEADVYEDQGGGFFFRKLADGSYDQTVFWRDESGNYHPYSQDA